MPRVPSAAAAHIGKRIAAARASRGVTQDWLAVESGIDSSNIRGYESGRAMVSVHTLMRIADALDVPPGDLLDGLTLDLFDEVAARRQKAG
ncbi:helix-turn-helix domain-containing protein [Agromyces larvae]|uniref:Helix-turn-helix domain-containing protein n=1 Tax=Agromyces larvae TaxID=2929802 RepID=A0ABY4BWA9_9MICO|nr:helix-turn-helix transcriptional regulator [Agromyces larvae]UOE43506.1 helix-turn-helix domain-containing protein [Agromyces larvae]